MKKIFDSLLLFIFSTSVLSFTAGTLVILPIGVNGINVYLLDISAICLFLVWLLRLPVFIEMILSDKHAKIFYVFCMVAIISLIFTPYVLSLDQKIISFFYLIRLMSYFSFYISAGYLVKVKIINIRKITILLIVTSILMIIIGWIQYFLYPNLRNLLYAGWDPHLSRIFSTILDPNYFGIITVVAIILFFSYMTSGKNKVSYFLFAVSLVTLAFTYSRSSYIALFFGFFYLFYKKKKLYIFIVSSFVFLGIILLLPRTEGEGVKLERMFSYEARSDNWRLGMDILSDHPVLGVGFNTLRYVKRFYQMDSADIDTNHAGAGLDNSFLFVGATTGFAGLLIYLFFLRSIFTGGNLIFKTTLISSIVHGFFQNTLFFPWVLFWIFIFYSINKASERSN
jgi:hypothetical protein